MTELPQSQRFLMPALFGPTRIPDRTHVERVHTISISVQTERAPLARLLPRFFELDGAPILRVSRMQYDGVDYIGGRSYSEVLLSTNCIFHSKDGPVRAPYMFVLWVSDALPLISGREYMGHSKLMGEMGPLEETGNALRFGCAEYGTSLLEGRAFDLVELSGEKLDRVRGSTAEAGAFGWKLIQSPSGEMDADYPVLNMMRWDYDRVSTGRGTFDLFRPDYASAPASCDAINALADLPILSEGRAFVGIGSAVIDRTGTQQLVPQDASVLQKQRA